MVKNNSQNCFCFAEMVQADVVFTVR